MASKSCSLQGFLCGKVKSEPLIGAILNTDPSSVFGLSETSVAWQTKSHTGAVTCLLAHSCKIYDEFDQETLARLLISGCTDGIISVANSEDGSPIFTLHLHTDEVCVATQSHIGTYPLWLQAFHVIHASCCSPCTTLQSKIVKLSPIHEACDVLNNNDRGRNKDRGKPRCAFSCRLWLCQLLLRAHTIPGAATSSAAVQTG